MPVPYPAPNPLSTKFSKLGFKPNIMFRLLFLILLISRMKNIISKKLRGGLNFFCLFPSFLLFFSWMTLKPKKYAKKPKEKTKQQFPISNFGQTCNTTPKNTIPKNKKIKKAKKPKKPVSYFEFRPKIQCQRKAEETKKADANFLCSTCLFLC